MTTLAIVSGGYSIGSVTTANTTTYHPIGAHPLSQTVESLVETTMREAGSFTSLYVRLSLNGISSNSTISLRDNNVTVNNTVSLTASTTGEFEDTTPHTDTIVAGHKYNVIFIPGAATGTVTITNIRPLFNTTTNTVTRLICDQNLVYSTASTTYYFPLNGSTTANTTEANVKNRQRLAGTMQNLMLSVPTNGTTSAGTILARIDIGSGSINGNMTKSITGSTTGWYEDTVNSDTVAVGNDYNIAFITPSGTVSYRICTSAVSFLSTAGYVYCLNAYVGFSPNSTTTKYYTVGGALANTTATESQAQMKAGEVKQFRELTTLVSANSTGASTFQFRKNTANGNMIASITASSTGVFSNSTNVDYVVASDEINYSYTPGAASGVTIQTMSSWAVKGTAIPLTDSASISAATPARMIGRNALPVFAHTYG